MKTKQRWRLAVMMALVYAMQGSFEAIWVGALVALAVAIYCVTLPDTPPLAVSPRGKHALRESLGLARRPEIAVFLVTAFGVYLTAPMVYQVMPGYLEWRGLPRAWISTTMTLGQVTEIAMLAALPWLLRRFGAKGTLTLGISAWFVRFLSLALRPPLWLAVTGTLLHGVGFACLTVGGCALYRQPVRGSSSRQRSGISVGLHVGNGGALGQRDGW
jgi:Na+/melibiose symporter-like transporter